MTEKEAMAAMDKFFESLPDGVQAVIIVVTPDISKAAIGSTMDDGSTQNLLVEALNKMNKRN